MTERPKLFSPVAIAVHTFFFSPLVGGSMAAANWRRLGDTSRATKTLAISFASILVIGLVSAFAPESWHWIPGAIGGATVAIAIGLKREQEAPFGSHVAAGGAKASPLLATLAGLLLVGLFVAALLLSNGGDEHFQSGVTAFNEQRYDAAEREFRLVLASDAANDDAHYNLALTLVRQQRFDDARQELARIHDSAEVAADAHVLAASLAGR